MEFFFADSAGFFVDAGSFDLYTLNETFDPEGEKEDQIGRAHV